MMNKAMTTINLAYEVMEGGDPETCRELMSNLNECKREIEDELKKPQTPESSQAFINLIDRIDQALAELNKHRPPEPPSLKSENTRLENIVIEMVKEGDCRQQFLQSIRSQNYSLKRKLEQYEKPQPQIEKEWPSFIYEYPENPFESDNSSNESESEYLNFDLTTSSRISGYNLPKPSEFSPVDLSEPVIANFELYRKNCCSDSGVLYDSDNIQIGIRVYYIEHQIRGDIYFGNKLNEEITDLEAEIIDYKEEGLLVELIDNLRNKIIPPNKSLNIEIKVSFTEIIDKTPLLLVTLGTSKILLKLPITIIRLASARKKNGEAIHDEWKSIAEHDKTEEISLKGIESFESLKMHLAQSQCFCVLSKNEIPELNPAELISRGRLTKEFVYVKISIRNPTQATLSVRCKSQVIRETIFKLMYQQFSGNFETSSS